MSLLQTASNLLLEHSGAVQTMGEETAEKEHSKYCRLLAKIHHSDGGNPPYDQVTLPDCLHGIAVLLR